jgi:hypothetical protein
LTWLLDDDHKHKDTRDQVRGRNDFLPRAGSVMEALDSAEAPFVRNASNAIESDHSAPLFCVLNLRDAAVREYWTACWQYAHDELGLRGIFLDSSFNMTID